MPNVAPLPASSTRTRLRALLFAGPRLAQSIHLFGYEHTYDGVGCTQRAVSYEMWAVLTPAL